MYNHPNFMSQKPKRVIAAVLVITAIAMVGAARLKVSFSLRSLYDYPGNQDVPVLDKYVDEFGDDGGFVAAIIHTDNVFTHDTLSYIKDLSTRLERNRSFGHVFSLSENNLPRANADAVETGPLFDDPPTDPQALDRLRRIALAHALAVPRLVSADGHYALVGAELRTPAIRASLDVQEAAVQAVRQTIKELPPPKGVEVSIGGNPVIEAELRRTVLAEQQLFGGCAFVLIVITLWLAFGTWHGILLPFSGVVIATTWMLGLMGWMGLPIDMISNTGPTILLIYGLLDSIFVISTYYYLVEKDRNAKSAVAATIRRVGWPCVLTSATTAIGFACFSISPVAIMQRYGVVLATGVMFACAMSLMWVPAILAVVKPPSSPFERRLAYRIAKYIATAAMGVARRRKNTVIAICAVVTAVALSLAIFKNEISVLYVKELPQNAKGVQALNLLADHLVGTISTAVTIEGRKDQLLEPDVLKRIAELDRWIESNPSIRSSLALSDIVTSMNQAFNDGKLDAARIPDDRNLIAQYLTIIDPDVRTRYVTADYARTHIRVLGAENGSARWRREFFDPLQKKARELLPEMKLVFTGYAVAAHNGIEAVVDSMIETSILAFFVIAVLVGICFKSARLGTVVALPNFLPACCCLALVGLMGVSLRIGTTLFLSVSIGMVYDNTIQIMSAVREEFKAPVSREVGFSRALAAVGPPMLFTAVLLCFGFGIFWLSDFEMLKAFGFTCVVTVAFGVASDLLVTVALLDRAGLPWLLKKKLGRDAGTEATAEADDT